MNFDDHPNYRTPKEWDRAEPDWDENIHRIDLAGAMARVCHSCPNNQKDGGSGICHCTLGSMVSTS